MRGSLGIILLLTSLSLADGAYAQKDEEDIQEKRDEKFYVKQNPARENVFAYIKEQAGGETEKTHKRGAVIAVNFTFVG